jgi:catechol 2,3-dioxygenase-like lactoylglutathione lyase family enzyme
MQLGHIGLNVTELDRSIRFYTEVLGFKLRARLDKPGQTFALLGNDSKNLVTLWQQSEGAFSPQLPGLHHLAFEVETIEAVKLYEEKLKAHSVPFIYEGIVAHSEGGDSGGIYFSDPDGLRLEIFTSSGVSGHSSASAHGPSCGFF